MKYKLLCTDDEWLPRDAGIKLWMDDSEGRSRWPRGFPPPLKPSSMRNLDEIKRGLQGFINHWEQLSAEDSTGEYRRRYEPLCYYWRGVKDALDLPFDDQAILRDGFWPMSRIAPSFVDQFAENGEFLEEYAEDDHFVGQARDRPPQSFRVNRDVYEGYFLALHASDDDGRPFWVARALSDPNASPEHPGCLLIQYFMPTSKSRIIQDTYQGWDSVNGLQWKIDDSQPEHWEDTDSLLTSWKSKVRKSTKTCKLKIPQLQIDIIRASISTPTT